MTQRARTIRRGLMALVTRPLEVLFELGTQVEEGERCHAWLRYQAAPPEVRDEHEVQS